MNWDEKYRGNNRIWGNDPSELAPIAVAYLQRHTLGQDLSILDIGCGYGRDTTYFANHLKGKFVGIDSSREAINMAKSMRQAATNIEFRCHSFAKVDGEEYDVVFASNLYLLLKSDERAALRETISKLLKPEGCLFLGALSTNDPQEYGKGTPVPGEPNSFKGKSYRHFCTREELLEDFGFLEIKVLYEHEYDEPRAKGDPHHHISWILIGSRRPQPT